MGSLATAVEMTSKIDEAFEVVRGGDRAAVILTCEHASERLPAPWRWPAGDERLVGTHWAFDPGAAELTRELAARLGAVAILSRFSRLLSDPNRAEDEPSLFRDLAEGAKVQLNAAVEAADRQRRLALYYRPFHAAIDREVAATSAHTLLSVHSFTPLYEGQRRWLEVGVLFDRDEELGLLLVAAFDRAGFHVRPNEPYSGKDGLIHSAATHAAKRDLRAVEIEVRQDLAVVPAFRARVIDVLAAAFAG
jgi:predicted N-formylglutamate amidohydrolase